jgi:hypothetical protein
VRGKRNKLGEVERKVRLGQDKLAIKSGNERKLYTLFYPHPLLPALFASLVLLMAAAKKRRLGSWVQVAGT